jgi:single-stranded-DNA-specific exonuclease
MFSDTRPWLEPPETHVPDALQRAVGGHPLVASILARRGMDDVEAARAFLDPGRYTPASPGELPDLERAAERLQKAIRETEPVLVWGDFDVDGQTATTLLVSALRDLGARIDYHIPVRAGESHGVGAAVLESLLDERPARVLLTCDTGVAAHPAVDYANGRGLDVLITDHHELPERLPEALAVVNPRRLPEGHPLRTLPGVGVAYKLAEQLYRLAGRDGEEAQYQDLAALGIVADVATQTGDARYLLQRGLELLRTPQRIGLKAIYTRAELDATWLTEEHIGFVLAPRLNAIGRLGDANPVVELLTTQDPMQARILALQLEGLNSRRQLLTSQVTRAALAQVEADRSLLDYAVLVLAHPAWEAGVVGIVASRMVERFDKPAILIACPPGELGRGSARSVEGIDITAAIALQAELLEGFGGHSMAAGFAIRPENIDAFRRGLSVAVEEAGLPPKPGLHIDAYLPWEELSLDLAADLERLAPFGPGNPALVLASRDLRLANHARVGREGEHLLLTVENEVGLARRVIWWNGGDTLEPGLLPQGRFDLAYNTRASTFRGQRDVQVQFVDLRILEEAIPLQVEKPPVEVLDYRDREHPLALLERLLADDPTAQVWAEAEAPQRLRKTLLSANLRSRLELEMGETLVVWTSPAALADLLASLEAVQPRRVVLFAVDPGLDSLRPFIERLAGLAKYALREKGGMVSLPQLAAAMAQRPLPVRLGLEWLAARGHLTISATSEEQVELHSGGEIETELVSALQAQLVELLAESRAWREYYARASVEALIG